MKHMSHKGMKESQMKSMPTHMEHGNYRMPMESNNVNKGIDRHLEVRHEEKHLQGKERYHNVHHFAKVTHPAELNRGKVDMGNKPKMGMEKAK